MLGVAAPTTDDVKTLISHRGDIFLLLYLLTARDRI
jgi:hypothetical protein